LVFSRTLMASVYKERKNSTSERQERCDPPFESVMPVL
jgi:hypothetical protein